MEKKIKGFEDYTISEDGKVYSHKYKIVKELRGFVNKGGYKYVDLSKNNKTTRFGVHQLVAMHYVKGRFDGAVVNHKDGNTLNNHYTNLEWVTQRENIRQGYETSGIGAMRHYLYHILVYPDGTQTEPMAGQQIIKEYIETNHLDTSFSMLFRRGHSRGFELITLH